jgi:hypothetical protein
VRNICRIESIGAMGLKVETHQNFYELSGRPVQNLHLNRLRLLLKSPRQRKKRLLPRRVSLLRPSHPPTILPLTTIDVAAIESDPVALAETKVGENEMIAAGSVADESIPVAARAAVTTRAAAVRPRQLLRTAVARQKIGEKRSQ